MTITEKISTIDNKIEQDKAQYDLDRQIAEVSAWSSGNISQYEVLTGKDVFLEKDLLEKAVAMKWFEYFPLEKELKAQTDIVKKQYQGLDKIYQFHETINKKSLLKSIKNEI